MTFTPDYRHMADVARNVRPARLPLYEHTVGGGIMEKVLGRELSPIYHVTPGLPPIFIVHGAADTLVPLDQSERFVERAQTEGNEVQLEVRPGKKHGWPTMILDVLRFADWCDAHL